MVEGKETGELWRKECEQLLIQTPGKKDRPFPRFQTTNKPKCRFWKEKKTKPTRLEKISLEESADCK